MEQDSNNREWSFQTNISGITPATGQGAVPEGYYKATITDMYIRAEKPNRVIFKMSITEGTCKGAVRTDGLNIPQSDDDNVRYFWRALAESVGYEPSQLDAGSVELSPTSFVDKNVFFKYTPKDEEKGRNYDNFLYLAPGEWNQQRQTGEANTRTETPVEEGSDAGGATKKQILAQLQ